MRVSNLYPFFKVSEVVREHASGDALKEENLRAAA